MTLFLDNKGTASESALLPTFVSWGRGLMTGNKKRREVNPPTSLFWKAPATHPNPSGQTHEDSYLRDTGFNGMSSKQNTHYPHPHQRVTNRHQRKHVLSSSLPRSREEAGEVGEHELD